MPNNPLQAVLRAGLVSTRCGFSPRTDAELLAMFTETKDEAAFAELVRRHGRLVRGTARRVAGDANTAEDVFQATFMLLAQKAAVVSWGPTVGPWLYQAARRLAIKARTRAARRCQTPLETDIPAPPSDPSAGLAWTEIRDALDHALAALPARLRDPLVLCYLEGLTQDEAAAALGCSAAAIKGRVTRGRERLRQLLGRRGLSLSTALAGPLVIESAISADAAAATAQAAAAFRATGAAPAAVQALLQGTPLSWKLATGLIALVLACAAGAVGLGGVGPTAEPVPPPVAAAHHDTRTPAAPAVDAFGDPLPEGALARLGSRRLCSSVMAPEWVAFSPDGTKIASWGYNTLTVWDAASGRLLVQRQGYNNSRFNTLGWRKDGVGIAIVFLPDRSHFVSEFTNPVEKLPTPPPAPPIAGPNRAPNPGPDVFDYLALSPDATQLATVQNPSAKQFTINVMGVTPGRLVADLKVERTLGPFPGPCREVRYTAGGHLVFLSGPWKAKGDWSIALVDPEKNVIARTTRIPPPGFCVWGYMLSLSADARLAAFPPNVQWKTNTHEDTIRVWDLVAGKELWSLPFPDGGYGTGHAFTPDGKRLIASNDKIFFQVWDVATGKETARSPVPLVTRYASGASAVGVSPDGKRFVTGRHDGRLDIWDTATGKAVVPLATHRDIIDTVAASPDGRLVATHSFDDSIRVWELATGKPVCLISAPFSKEPHGHLASKQRAAFTPDSRGLLFSAAGKLEMADPLTGKPLNLPDKLRDTRGSVGGFAADGKTLATFTDDVVTLWEWPDGTVRVRVTVPLEPDKAANPTAGPETVIVNSVALAPDGRFLFTNSIRWQTMRGGYPNANDLWDGQTGKRLHRLTTLPVGYPPAVFSLDGQRMYLGGHSFDSKEHKRKRTDALTVWNPATGTLLQRFADVTAAFQREGLRELGRSVVTVAVSPDGRLLAAAEQPPAPLDVYLYETVSGEVVRKFTGHSRWVTDLVFSPDGRRLVSVSEDQTGLVWDVTLPALGGNRGEKPTDTRLPEACDQLALDAEHGYAGMAVLAAAPAKAIPLLRAKLRHAFVPTDADLDRVVEKLNANAFDDREKASADLERFGPNAVAGAKARLDRATSAEVRERLKRFLERYDSSAPSPYQLRCVRGVAVLEAIGTADAKTLLNEWTKGPPNDLLTREAQAASRRLSRQ